MAASEMQAPSNRQMDGDQTLYSAGSNSGNNLW